MTWDDIPIIGSAKKWLFGEDTSKEQQAAAGQASDELQQLLQQLQQTRQTALNSQYATTQPEVNYINYLYGNQWGQNANAPQLAAQAPTVQRGYKVYGEK